MQTPQGSDTTDERAPQDIAGWRRWLTPSGVVGIAVLGSIPVRLLSTRLADPDLWWHLRSGRLILERNSIPTTDPYSFTAHGEEWVVQEWLPELLLHGLREWFGLYGILVYRALATFVLYAIVARLLSRHLGNGMGMWALLGLTAYAGASNWTERPNLLSYILFAVTLTLLERRDRAIWWFVPLAALWANMHGMVLIGVGLVAVVAAAEALKLLFRWPGADAAWTKRAALVAAAGLAATLANPVGPRLLAHAFRLIGAVTSVVTEWASPDFHETGVLVFLALLLLAVVTLAMSARRPDPTDLALMLAFTVLALQAVRNLALASIVLGLVTAKYIRSALETVPVFARPGEARPQVISIPLGVMGLVMTFVGLGVVLAAGIPRSDAMEDIVDGGYPVAAIDALNEPGICVFANDPWSGMIIDRAWPNAYVAMDLRTDLYGLARAQRYQRTMAAYPEWRRNLDEDGVTHVLIRPYAPLAAVLAQDDGWVLLRKDRNSVTYERADRRRCTVPPAAEA